VKKALNSQRNFELTAVKIVDRIRAPRDYQEKFMPRELALWPRLCHPNLIRFLDYFEDNQRVYMVMSIYTDILLSVTVIIDLPPVYIWRSDQILSKMISKKSFGYDRKLDQS